MRQAIRNIAPQHNYDYRSWYINYNDRRCSTTIIYLHEKRRDVINNSAKYIIDELGDNFTSTSVRKWSVSAIPNLYYTN